MTSGSGIPPSGSYRTRTSQSGKRLQACSGKTDSSSPGLEDVSIQQDSATYGGAILAI
jgi:hypothetical protein